jgi:hypothetical protein
MTAAVSLGRRYYVAILLVCYSLIVPLLINPKFMILALWAPVHIVSLGIRGELRPSYLGEILLIVVLWIAFLVVPLTVYPRLVARDKRWDHWAIRCAIGFGLGWICVFLLPS